MNNHAIEHRLETTSLSVTTSLAGFVLRDNEVAQDLISLQGGWPLIPVIDGTRLDVAFEQATRSDRKLEITFATKGHSKVHKIFLCIERAADTEDAIDLSCHFTTESACTMGALEIAPPRTILNVYDVVNFRNRHFCAATWPELPVGGKFETTTYSDDWQFAPHPTAMIFRKNDIHLFAGFRALMPSFGMRLGAERNRVLHWDVDFGGTAHGLPLKAGETFSSAPLRLFLRRNTEPYAMFAEFGNMLVKNDEIADPSAKSTQAWWREPLYCTWGDQGGVVDCPSAVDLQAQANTTALTAAAVLDEAFVRKAVAIIKRERLPIRTILLDEGWAKARGDWTPHPQRFPNFRKLIDELHADGFKVMIWWNWAEISPSAEVDHRYLARDGWINKHGCRWRDCSDEAVREGYLKPLMRTFFSNEPGCYDLDGVKTDFLADKVYAATPVADPNWRGEEKYFQKITEYFYGEMRCHKPDAMHMGCAGNYWLAQYMDTNRTYDVHSSNWIEHEERARMMKCTAPGVILSYDMVTCLENMAEWFDSAAKLDAAIEIGSVMALRPDIFSPGRPLDASYFDLLRKKLK